MLPLAPGPAQQVVTVTINGTNDVPVIGGVSTASVTEDASVVDGAIDRKSTRLNSSHDDVSSMPSSA